MEVVLAFLAYLLSRNKNLSSIILHKLGCALLISFHCYNFRTNHFNWLLKWMSATLISMSILGETIGTCILAYFILHETISLQQGLGITVIFIGLVLFYYSHLLKA